MGYTFRMPARTEAPRRIPTLGEAFRPLRSEGNNDYRTEATPKTPPVAVFDLTVEQAPEDTPFKPAFDNNLHAVRVATTLNGYSLTEQQEIDLGGRKMQEKINAAFAKLIASEFPPQAPKEQTTSESTIQPSLRQRIKNRLSNISLVNNLISMKDAFLQKGRHRAK